MTNQEVIKKLCNAICNTFYPDDSTIEVVCFNEGIDASATATPKDVQLFRCALSLVVGYVEGSRSENGISTSVFAERVKNSIAYWCGLYGLDADEELANFVRRIKDMTHRW